MRRDDRVFGEVHFDDVNQVVGVDPFFGNEVIVRSSDNTVEDELVNIDDVALSVDVVKSPGSVNKNNSGEELSFLKDVNNEVIEN